MRFKRGGQSGIGHLLLVFIVLVGWVIVFAGYKVYQNKKPLPSVSSSGVLVSYDQTASRALTAGNCSGAGAINIGPPMKPEQTGFVLPYGLVVGGHVTPVDHQYYIGLNFRAPRDTYEVIAPGDGTIVSIQHRGNKTNTPLHSIDVPSSDEYRLVFVHTCSFLTYEDLITTLTPDIVAKLPGGHTLTGSNSVGVNIPVKKGQVIGYIGGQTLDFAVWDLSKPLKGFISYADYTAEAWKPYTAPPTAYMDSATKAAVVSKYVRTAAPLDGKIDYDIDGKLIGNWFKVGTGGYHAQDNTAQAYWTGHLSIAPDFIDPNVYNASIGNYGGYPGAVAINNDAGTPDNQATQFMIKNATPDPATVGQSTGAVKYELAIKSYVLPSGAEWNNSSFATSIKATSKGSVLATALAQLTGSRTLRFEVFPGKNASQVTSFDGNATTYTR